METVDYASYMYSTVHRLSRSGAVFYPRSGQVSWVRYFRGFPNLQDKCQEALGQGFSTRGPEGYFTKYIAL